LPQWDRKDAGCVANASAVETGVKYIIPIIIGFPTKAALNVQGAKLHISGPSERLSALILARERPVRRIVSFSVTLAAVTMFGWGCLAQNSVALPDDILQEFLDSGKWSVTADEKTQFELLDQDLARTLVRAYHSSPTDPQAIGQLGLLVLATSVAEWGITPPPDIPDPAHDQDARRVPWSGVSWNLGKHLMSYTIGGVGIIHADKTILAKFMKYLVITYPNLGPESPTILHLADSLEKSTTYDQIKTNPTFLIWMKNGLHQKEAQRWMIEYWINNTWITSYEDIVNKRHLANEAALKEAFINARIRNTSPELAGCISERAKSDDDELAFYVATTPCNGKPADKRRLGEMKRPRVLFDYLVQ
jgi:hypothetical protein